VRETRATWLALKPKFSTHEIKCDSDGLVAHLLPVTREEPVHAPRAPWPAKTKPDGTHGLSRLRTFGTRDTRDRDRDIASKDAGRAPCHLARALGATWVIGEEPTLEYRQHDSNVQGANSGAGATRARMEKLRSGFYRRQFILVAQACLSVGSYDARERRALESLAANLRSTSVWSRFAFALRFARIRRQLTEGIKLAGARVLGVW